MRITKKIAAVAIVAGIAVTGGAAYAYFTSSGSGDAGASVGTSEPWKISVVSNTGGPIYPGFGAEVVSYKVTNDGDGHQYLNGASVAVDEDDDGDILAATTGNPSVAGCKAEWFVVDNTGSPAAIDLAADGFASGSASISMTNTGNQNACKDAAPKLVISAN